MNTWSKYEQETIIRYNEEEDFASVSTENKALLSELEQLAEEMPVECKFMGTYHSGRAARYIVPKSWVRITAQTNDET